MGWSERGALAVEAVQAYARVRWLLRSQPLPAILATLRTRRDPPAASLADLPAAAAAAKLAGAVDRTLGRLPGDTRCLTRSLVLTDLLARRGIDTRLALAVLPGDDALKAHAWVELDGRPLLPPADPGFRRLATL